MLRSLTSAISGLQNFQTRMDVIGNNIANVNTVGYKGARTDFADSFSQTLRQSSSSTGVSTGMPSMQIGSGTTVNSIKNIYTQGALSGTGVLTDLAISGGNGFFMVRDNISGEDFVTRAGNFRLDKDKYLVTEGGLRVQGYTSDPTAGGATIGDVQINLPQGDTRTINAYTIDSQGMISVRLNDGNELIRGQVLLLGFNDPQGLVKVGSNLYNGMEAAGAVGPASPGTNGLGQIESGSLELSNVELSTEFANMITAQRAFQATARVITTSDEMLQELVNLKR